MTMGRYSRGVIPMLRRRLLRCAITGQSAVKLALSRQGRVNFRKGGGRSGGVSGAKSVMNISTGKSSRVDALLSRNRPSNHPEFARGKIGIYKGRFNHDSGKLLGLVRHSPPGTPPYFQSGRLRNSIAFAWRGALRIRVGTNVRYARWLEFGTKGGKVIVPKTKKVLFDPVSGLFFGKRVIQGPIKPRPYMRPTAMRLAPTFRAIMKGKA